jgi:hypothetical protein
MKIKSILNERSTWLFILINAIGVVLMVYKVMVIAPAFLYSLQAIAISVDLISYIH